MTSLRLDSEHVPEGSRWVAAVLVLGDGSYRSSGLIPHVAGETMRFELPAEAVRAATSVVFKGYAEHQISSLFCPNDDVLSSSPLYAFDRATLNAAAVPLLPTDRWNMRGAIDGGEVKMIEPRPDDEVIYLGAEWMPDCPIVVRTTDSYEAYCRPDLRCRGESAGEISPDACSVVVFTPRQLVGNLMSDCEHVELESATFALDFPPSNSATDRRALALFGTTAGDVPIVELRVNNATASVGLCHQRFSASVPLELGTNTLEATAIDAFGHATTAPLGAFLRGSFPARPSDIEVRGDRAWIADEVGLHELSADGLRLVADDPSTGRGGFGGVAVAEDGSLAFLTHRDHGVLELDPREAEPSLRMIAADVMSPIDLALERSGRSLLISNGNPLELLRVDLPNNERRAVSSLSLGTGPMFSAQHSLALGADPNRAFIADGRAILEVDTTSGDRSIFTDCSSGLEHASDIAVDANTGTALLTDEARGAVVSIDLQTGACTLLFGPSPGGGPSGVAFDPARGRALVSDRAAGAISAIDLQTGDRSAAADFHVGDGPALGASRFAAFDPRGSRILATDATNGAIVAFDLATGNRSLLPGPALLDPAGIAIDPRAPRAIVAVRERVVAIELDSGARTELSGPDRGAGPAWERPTALAIDADQNLAFVLDAGRLLELRLDTGDRRVLEEETNAVGLAFDPISKQLIAAAGAIHVDAGNQRSITVDTGDLTATDLVSGAVAVISADRAPGPKLLSAGAVAIAGGDPRTIYVLDVTRRALFAVDARTGARAIISR